MSTTTPTNAYQPSADKPLSLDQFPARLRERINSGKSTGEIYQYATRMLCELSGAMWCGVMASNGRQAQADNSTISQPARLHASLQTLAQHNGIESLKLAVSPASVIPTFQKAIEQRSTSVSRSGPMTVIAASLSVDDMSDAQTACAIAIGLALDLGPAPAEPFLLAVQLAAAELSKLELRRQSRLTAWQSEATAAVADLMLEVSLANDEKSARELVALRLNEFLVSQHFAVGQCLVPDGLAQRIIAISGVNQLDSRSTQSSLWREALQECCFRQRQLGKMVTCVTTHSDPSSDSMLALAHRNCLAQYQEQSGLSANRLALLTCPLIAHSGQQVGALGCVLDMSESTSGDCAAEHLARVEQFLTIASPYVASTLHLRDEATGGLMKRCLKRTTSFGRKRRFALALVCGLLLVGSMAMPITYRVAAPVSMVAAASRYAVAPYDGVLERCLVEPGDIVQPGQTLARLDPSELELKRTELSAQRQRAAKKRDVYRSSAHVADMQIASYEEQQLVAQLELIEHRLANLDVIASDHGVVLQSPMKDARHAPVKTGEVLVQFAELSQLTGELNVDEAELTYLEFGQAIEFTLDGQPLQKWNAKLQRIRPASEIRNGRNVFVAEFDWDNTDQSLRPGMRGEARIATEQRPLVWILFHRAWESLVRFWG